MTQSVPGVTLEQLPAPAARYAKSLLAIGAAALAVLASALTDDVVTGGELVNVGIAVVTAIGVFLLPNLDAGHARFTKAGVAVAGAGLVALASYLSDGVTSAEWLLVILAGLGAVGVGIIPNAEPLPEARDGRHEAGAAFAAPAGGVEARLTQGRSTFPAPPA